MTDIGDSWGELKTRMVDRAPGPDMSVEHVRAVRAAQLLERAYGLMGPKESDTRWSGKSRRTDLSTWKRDTRRFLDSSPK